MTDKEAADFDELFMIPGVLLMISHVTLWTFIYIIYSLKDKHKN